MPNDDQSTVVTDDEQEIPNIPEETQNKFPELIAMIKVSQSMDAEEQQYWVDVLPIMTESQVSNLKSILDNEKEQMEEADRELEEDIEKEAVKAKAQFDEFKYLERKRIRDEAERKHEREEKEHEKALLEEIESL